MAQPAETLDRYDLAASGDNVREQLANQIWDISPTETPFVSSAGKGGNSNTLFGWLLDELRAPNANNAHIDGDDFTATALTTPARIENYNQIMRGGVVVSGRADTVNKAGRNGTETARQVLREGMAIRRDMETIFTGNQGARAGNSTTAPLTATLCAFYTTNDLRGTGGAAAPLSNGTSGFPNAAATDGTLRALSETLMLDAVQSAWVNGGMPSEVLVSAQNKRNISNYLYTAGARIATPYQDHGAGAKAASVTGTVDYWCTDFGTLHITPDRFCRDRDVHILDYRYWSVDALRNFRTKRMGDTGDSTKRLLLIDAGLCSKNEAASAVVADVDHSTAMVA